MRHEYIEPNSPADQALVALQSAINLVMTTDRGPLIDEAKLSDYIKEVHADVLKVSGYLCEIIEEAETQVEVDYVFDRLGGFA